MSLTELLPRLQCAGRGKHYTLPRALLESALRMAFVGDWPARLWARTPFAGNLRVVRHEFELLGGLERPLRIAFASDLHLGPTTAPRTLDAAFAALREAAPDVLLLGGDYVFLDANAPKMAELEARIASVPAPIKLAVLGNHDLWTDQGRIERALERAGVRLLTNDAMLMPAPFSELAILGLDDPWTGEPDAERAISACGEARVRLALAHSPDAIGFLRGRGISLLLCGHTHGGQIALPGERPIVLPPGPYSRRYAFGLHSVDDLTLYVSRGIGAAELPIRAYAAPEIAIVSVR